MNHTLSDSEEQNESINVTTTAAVSEAAAAEEDDDDDTDSSESSSSGGDADGASSSSAASSSDEEYDGDYREVSPPADAALELAKIANDVLPLPRGLCENAAIFREFFSLQTWRLVPPELRAHLQTLLPRFEQLEPACAVAEQQRTLIMLLGGGDGLQRFGSTPLGTLQQQLEVGNCRPDVARLRQSIAKSRRRECRFQTCERVSQLAKQLFVSRERLLRAAFKSSPPSAGDTAAQHTERTLRRELPSLLYADTRLCAVRARKRYATEVREMTLALDLQSPLSADENDDVEDVMISSDLAVSTADDTDLFAVAASKSGGAAPSASTTDKCIYGTLFKRRHDLASDEEAVRAAQHAKQPRLSNRNFRQYLLDHKRRKLTEPTLPDFETSDIRLRDVCARAQMGGNFKRIFATGKAPGRKPKSKLLQQQQQQTNEPPALVPIVQPQPTAAQRLRNANSKQQQLQIYGETAIQNEFQPGTGLDANHELLQQQAQQQQLKMYLGRQNQTQLQQQQQKLLAEEHTRLEYENSDEDDDDENENENDDNEAFNMMDGEVELQQEEVETYGVNAVGVGNGGSSTCEETIPAFVISNEVDLPQVGVRHQDQQQRMPLANLQPQVSFAAPKSQPASVVRLEKKTTSTSSMPIYATQNHIQQQQHFQQLTMDNLPKLEPLTALNKTTTTTTTATQQQIKEKSLYSAITTTLTPASTSAAHKTPLNTILTTLAPLKKIAPPASAVSTLLLNPSATYSASGSATASSVSPLSLYTANPELIQETHSCFFSLIRDFFCATPNHRMKFDDLKTKIDVWLCNPITALNDWYALAENWSALLSSAINFLAGDFAELPDEYVPYIEHKTQLNIYQWIGAGRDTDTRLSALCQYWMQRRSNDVAFTSTSSSTSTSTSALAALADNRNNNELKRAGGIMGSYDLAANLMRRHPTVALNELLDGDISAAAAASGYDAAGNAQPPPPPPRCPTTWTVRAATDYEIAEFQRQERERFEHPHRAYTYRMHGYDSIVGPVKGIYSQILALTKARGHSMMIGDRPNFVTILTLVRDATARLPNGEGTRADISELLKGSQYINRDAAENVLQTIVSGALDRMHTEHDPCVRYDPKRKIWIYLHRNRSEAEFERMHQQYQGLGKHKKPAATTASRKPSAAGLTAAAASSASQKTTASMKIVTSKETLDGDSVAAGVLEGVLTERANVVTTLATPNAALTTNSSFSLPALVPANPIIVNSQQHQQQKQLTQQQSVTKSLPVPPLKYHNQPNQQQLHHQQQKSLLKSTFQHVQRTPGAYDISRRTPEPSEHQNHLAAAAIVSNQQRNQLRVSNASIAQPAAATATATATATTTMTTTTNKFNQPSQHGNSVLTVASNAMKQYSFSLPQSTRTATTAGVVSISNAVGNNSSTSLAAATTTPIIVATPSGLQTVHVSNATSVVVGQSAQTTATAGTLHTMQQQTPALSATVGGKKVALNKPIIINQITQTTLKTKSTSQIAKQLQQHQQQQQTPQPQSYFIPITSSAAAAASSNESLAQTPRHIQTIYMDNNTTQLLQATQTTSQQPQQQQQTKNIIRLVPTMNNSLKSLISSNSSETASVVNTSSSAVGVAAATSKQQQPVHIIGQRVIANTTVRPQQQQKTIGGISFVTSNAVVPSANATAAASNASVGSGGGSIVKMSPQAFASLQQKQAQHILLKQAVSGSQPQQQRVLVGNTAIIAQGSTNKSLVFQQQQQQGGAQKVVSLQQTNVTAAASVGSQTSQPAVSVVGGAANKIQTINTTNLTPQQQRVLLQNLKQQQQQQIQFKTVQVVASNAPPQQQQMQQSQMQQQPQQQPLLRNQAVTIGLQRSNTAVQTSVQAAQQTGGKTLAVVVSQAHGLTRLLKTTQQQAHIPHQTTVVAAATASAANESSTSSSVSTAGTRVLTTSTGQIISLESLLQKQGGALRITGGSGVRTTSATNLLQLAATSASNISGQQQHQAPQYAVVSQGRNVFTLSTSPPQQRLITTLAAASNTTTAAVASSTAPRIATSATTTIAGRIVSAGSGLQKQQQVMQVALPLQQQQQQQQQHKQPQQQQQQQVTNATKVFASKTTMAATNAHAAGNIRVINTGGGSFNIANLQGKQLLFATKQPAATGVHVKTLSTSGQAQHQLQNSSIIVGGQPVKIQSNAANLQPQQQLAKSGGGVLPASQMQTVIMGNQILRVQQMPQTLKTTSSSQNRITAAGNSSNDAILSSNTTSLPKTLVLGPTGQAIRLHQPNNSTSQALTVPGTTKNVVVGASTQHSAHGKTAPPASRVVLAVQGGGQIFLSPSFQGSTVNLKALQSMKMVSLAQTTKGPSTSAQEKLTATTTAITTTTKQLTQQSVLKQTGGGSGSVGGGGGGSDMN